MSSLAELTSPHDTEVPLPERGQIAHDLAQGIKEDILAYPVIPEEGKAWLFAQVGEVVVGYGYGKPREEGERRELLAAGRNDTSIAISHMYIAGTGGRQIEELLIASFDRGTVIGDGPVEGLRVSSHLGENREQLGTFSSREHPGKNAGVERFDAEAKFHRNTKDAEAQIQAFRAKHLQKR